MSKPKKPNRFHVFCEIDRGEGAKPRYVGGYCHLFGKTREEAERVAAAQRAAGRLNVRVEERPDDL